MKDIDKFSLTRRVSLFCKMIRFPLILLSFWLSGCGKEPPPAGPQYQALPNSDNVPMYYFASHPLYNPIKLQDAYQPLMEYLNKHIPEAHFELESSLNYQAYEAKIRAALPEFLHPNPWQTLLAMQYGYHVIAEAGDSADFKGIFIVRKDSPIKTISDLKGKTVSYPSHTALAACIMPQYYLYQHGIDVRHDIKNLYVGSQESAIMNAYLKESDIASTWPPPWRLFQREHSQEASKMQVIWETPTLINNSIMVRQDVPAFLADQVRALLLDLQNQPEGAQIFYAAGISAYYFADNTTYDKVRPYITNFEKAVRPVEQK